MDAENIPDKAPQEPEASKKPYTPPSFRFESAFEVMALACGKVISTQGGCHFSRQAS
jgi:hypothetical protein